MHPSVHQRGSCGGITPAELAAVRGRLEAFAAEVLESLPRKDQRARGECYLRGLMLDGRRKSIEPMAARLKEVHYQALHHFVAVSPWDWRPVRRRLAERLVGEVEPTAWAVDDTGFPKDGERSVGVQPFQYGEAFRVFRFDLPWEPPRADSEAPLSEA
jgi:SRSO17 transposase